MVDLSTGGNPNMNPLANYTPPNANTLQYIMQQSQQNQQQAASSPIGISPHDAGTIAGKVLNGGFSDKLNQATNFLDNKVGTQLGFGTSTDLTGALPGSTTASAIPSGLSTGDVNFLAQAQTSAGIPGALNPADSGLYNIVNNGVVADDATATGASAASTADSLAANAGSWTSTSFSSMLGSAGIGALGGGLLAKLTGGNQLGGSIGGAIGAAGGAALMGTELGSAIGSMIPIPGLGTIAGGAIGGLIGGMFGSKSPPTNADAYGAHLNANGSLNTSTATAGSKNAGPEAGFGQTASNQFSSLLQTASQQLGINFNPNLTVGTAISTRHPGPGGPAAIEVAGNNYDSGKIFYNPSDPASSQKAELTAFMDAAKQSGFTDEAALTNFFNAQMQNQNNTGQFTPPAAPNIPVSSQTFAQFMSQRNASSPSTPTANPTPNIPAAASGTPAL